MAHPHPTAGGDPVVIGPINNLQGRFPTGSWVPPANTSQVAFALQMNTNEITDPSNSLYLELWADFGAGPVFQKALDPLWVGGPGQTAPSLVYQWLPTNTPRKVFGVIDCVSQVLINSGSFTFA